AAGRETVIVQTVLATREEFFAAGTLAPIKIEAASTITPTRMERTEVGTATPARMENTTAAPGTPAAATASVQPTTALLNNAAALRTPTQTPTPLDLIKINPAVSTAVNTPAKSEAAGELHLHFLVDDQPMKDLSFYFVKAKENAAGQWSAAESATNPKIYHTDEDGILEAKLAPGNYIAINADASDAGNQLMCQWGVQSLNASGAPVESLPFSITQEKNTEITVSLSKLQIELLLKNGKAPKSAQITLRSQGKDSEGKPVSTDRCEWKLKTNKNGIAQLIAGPGDYMIEVSDFRHAAVKFSNIQLGISETLRKVYRLPY
ncbi:MAG: hypothetical protein ABFD44_00170, partial [Anaerolineaceae bacterium]